jgi:hypothetical protein
LDHHKHFVLALLFRSHARDLDRFSNSQRRDPTLFDTFGGERELQLLFEIIVPTERLLLRAVCIDDDFHHDPLFAFFIA